MIKVFDGKVFREEDQPLWKGDMIAVGGDVISTSKPELHWKGGKIPYDTYCQVISFFKSQFSKTNGESQVRLFYNQQTGGWMAAPFPQRRSSGLTTEEIQDHPRRAELLSTLHGNGFQMMSSWHHHCSVSAFQSGTDKDDEKNSPGLHLTFGFIDKRTIDVHARVNMRMHFYDAILTEWIEMPIDISILPVELHGVVCDFYLKNPKSVAFPEVWMESLIESPDQRQFIGYGGRTYGTSCFFSNVTSAGLLGKGVKNQEDHEIIFDLERMVVNADRVPWERLGKHFKGEPNSLYGREDEFVNEFLAYYRNQLEINSDKDSRWTNFILRLPFLCEMAAMANVVGQSTDTTLED